MLKLFYTLLATELFLGGGGRLLEFGPGTLRMYLFLIVIMLFFTPQFWRQISGDVAFAFGMVIVFFVVHLPPMLVGIVKGVDPATVFAEVQPLFYFTLLPFFAQVLHKKQYVELTSVLIRHSGLVLALGYIVTLLCLFLGFLDFQKTYDFLNKTGEFMFRGLNGFFVYKGFLYLCLSLIFIIAMSRLHKILLVILLSSSIALTLTRGFMLSTFISIVLFFLLTRNIKALTLILTALFFVAVLLFGDLMFSDESIFLRKDVDVSDATRFEDIEFMLTNVNSLSLLFGHGFGSLISGSRLNIENSFLWIWWKSGLVGLIFWISPLILCYRSFKQIPIASASFSLGCAFFCSVVLIYIQSTMNPYLTNPIGLSFVMIAIFSLRKIVTDLRINYSDKNPLTNT